MRSCLNGAVVWKLFFFHHVLIILMASNCEQWFYYELIRLNISCYPSSWQKMQWKEKVNKMCFSSFPRFQTSLSNMVSSHLTGHSSIGQINVEFENIFFFGGGGLWNCVKRLVGTATFWDRSKEQIMYCIWFRIQSQTCLSFSTEVKILFWLAARKSAESEAFFLCSDGLFGNCKSS